VGGARWPSKGWRPLSCHHRDDSDNDSDFVEKFLSRYLREQELEQGSQQRFPSSSHVMHKLKEAQIQGYIGLCDASMRVKP